MRIMLHRSRFTLVGLALAGILVGCTACQESETGDETTQMQPASGPSRVNVQQVQDWMDQGEELVILDSRSVNGWQTASTKAAGAIRVPPHDVATNLESVPRVGRIIVYCT